MASHSIHLGDRPALVPCVRVGLEALQTGIARLEIGSLVAHTSLAEDPLAKRAN